MLTLLIAIDDHIGRFDPSMLTQQQMMELFFTPDESDPHEYAEPRFLDDACAWNGITCGAEGLVEEIEWVGWRSRIVGTIDFKRMPLSVLLINFFATSLCGEVDTSALPKSLTYLCLQDCKFTGSLHMSALPPRLDTFIVTGNRISVVGQICNLPNSLCQIIINEILVAHRDIHIGKLPDTDLEIDITECGIEQVTFEDQRDAMRVHYE